MILRGVPEYLEYWHLLLPGNSRIFIGNNVHIFILALINRPLHLWENLLPFFSICALVPIRPVKHLLSALVCVLSSSWQSGSCFQLLPSLSPSCFIPNPLSSLSLSESGILAWHKSQPNMWIRGWSWWGMLQMDSWSFGKHKALSPLAQLVCLLHTTQSQRLPVESALQHSEMYVQIP